MQIKNKKQLLTTLLSVLVSVFLVAGAAYATLTFSGTTITLSNSETIDNTTDGTVQVTSGVLKHAVDSAAYWTATQADGGAVTFNSVSDGTAGFTFSDPVSLTELDFQDSTYLYATSTIKDAERGIVSLYSESLGSAINTDNADRTAFLIRARMGSDADSVTTGRNAHALDVLMDCNADYAVATNLRNADIRGARIQAYGHNNVSGMVVGAYINSQVEGGYAFGGQVQEGKSFAGAVGLEVRLETSGTGTVTMTQTGGGTQQGIALLVSERIANAFTGSVTGIWLEKPYEGTNNISGTSRGIYFATDGLYNSATDFDIGIDFGDECVTCIDIGTSTTGIAFTGTITNAIDTTGTGVKRLGLIETTETATTTGAYDSSFKLTHTNNAALTSGRLSAMSIELNPKAATDAYAVMGAEIVTYLGTATVSGTTTGLFVETQGGATTLGGDYNSLYVYSAPGADPTGNSTVIRVESNPSTITWVDSWMTFVGDPNFAFDVSAQGTASSINDNKTGTPNGWLKINAGGHTRYIQLYE